MSAKRKRKIPKFPELEVPSAHDWRTTDEHEVNRRKLRAMQEFFRISNQDRHHPIHSNFEVRSGSGLTYCVEIRDLVERKFSCTCVDFRASGLGTCKHVEAVLLNLQRKHGALFRKARKEGLNRLVIELDRESDTLRLSGSRDGAPAGVCRCFNTRGLFKENAKIDPAGLLDRLNRRHPEIWISQEIAPWLRAKRQAEEAARLRHEYEMKVQAGEWPLQETHAPLFPYQREGMLHLAFKERALLADEMGLGKTIQAIAACALLHRLGNAQRALVVTPASLKTEWEEQIQKFTSLPFQVVFGPRQGRLQAYASAPFFTIVNYEQMRSDSLDVNRLLQPDIVILDEAQRIKNWSTKTAQATKRLQSRYAFVLTGTPIENRIDELHSLMDFLNPEILGPLFRFNRDFYELDERGRPAAYRNLEELHRRVVPYMIRRRKSDVEAELPGRTDRNRFVEMTKKQWESYTDHDKVAKKLLATAKNRPLRKVEQDILQRELATMRMICDTNFIVDPHDTACPKLAELERILEDAVANGAKIIVFSEWERMLQLVRQLCRKLGLGFAWHTGKVPQRKRRGEINAFKSDPKCRVFLSTDSGSTGLNLQNANIVVNCDLPWNPAKLEQRIARAWRKNQVQAVTVYNLVSENTIEHQMLDTLANKQALSDGVLDRIGDLGKVKLRGGRQAFLDKLQQMVATTPERKKPVAPRTALPADPPLAFAEQVCRTVGEAVLQCEERYPATGEHTVLLVVVEDKNQHSPRIESIFEEMFPRQSEKSVTLEIIDRATAEALERLETAGLYAPTFRSSRPLHPRPESEASGLSLSPEQLSKIEKNRAEGERKLKMAQVLGAGGFGSEARQPMAQAILQFGNAWAIANHQPEPVETVECLRPPIASLWAEGLPLLRKFLESENDDWQTAANVVAGRGANLLPST